MASPKTLSPPELQYRAAACHKLAGYIAHEVRRALPKPSTVREETIAGLLDRCFTWLHTLGRLREVTDFQAHSAGARALLELAIDMTLIARGPADTADRIAAWERSARLKAAKNELSLRPRTRKGMDGHAEHLETRKIMRAFVRGQEATIVAERKAVLGKADGKHPARWSGDSGLPRDARAADAVFRRAGFVRADKEHSARLNWAVHGSTLAISRGGVSIDEVALLAIEVSLRWAIVVIRMALEANGVLIKERRRILNRMRTILHLATLNDVLDENAAGRSVG